LGYLIDTCVWIDVEQGRLAPADIAAITGEAPVFLSPVTIAEMKHGAEIADDPGVRTRRLAVLRKLMLKPTLPIDASTGEVFGGLATALRHAGKSHRTRVQDLWLASQAVQHGHRLVTRNRSDFEDIPGLDLVLI
jgi:predicted nucleic acid-binding protein